MHQLLRSASKNPNHQSDNDRECQPHLVRFSYAHIAIIILNQQDATRQRCQKIFCTRSFDSFPSTVHYSFKMMRRRKSEQVHIQTLA